MEAIFSSSVVTPLLFLAVGSVIMYFILQYDKQQRNKMKKILTQTKDVQPLFMAKAINNKIKKIKPELNAADRTDIAKQLDELVENYDRGRISLPDYCHKLNDLLSMVA